MTEGEAEAAVLALGPKLEWRSREMYWVCDKIDGDEDGSYIIDKEGPFLIAYTKGHGLKPETDICPTNHFTLAAAKAACERHHATGSWD